ncbi:MAG: multidrug effflux MFS transporter, partial [Devosiaceae bacterium]|nr:multidrug effflux MFS transporter [Devosiaceae bacterium]
VISFYLIGAGIGQLLFGPLGDRFGRRNPLMFCFSVYVITALAATIVSSFSALIILRLVQGLGTAGFRVAALAIVRDLHHGRAMAEILSLVFMVFMIAPIVAPGIGQLILFTAPWQGIFLFVAFIGAISWVWAYIRLPESLDPENQRPLTVKSVFGGFKIVLTNRVSMIYSIAGMFVFGSLVGMLNSSQQIFVEIYGLGALFPIAFAGVAVLMAIASYLNSRMVRQYGMRRLAHFALIIFTICALTLLALSMTMNISLPVFYGLLGTLFFMFSWTAPNMNSLSMNPLGKVAGTAASTFGFFQTLGGALFGLWVGRLYNDTIIPLAAGFAIAGIISLILVLIAENGKLFGVGDGSQDS